MTELGGEFYWMRSTLPQQGQDTALVLSTFFSYTKGPVLQTTRADAMRLGVVGLRPDLLTTSGTTRSNCGQLLVQRRQEGAHPDPKRSQCVQHEASFVRRAVSPQTLGQSTTETTQSTISAKNSGKSAYRKAELLEL